MSKKLTARLSLLTLAFVIMIAFVLAWAYAPTVGTASAEWTYVEIEIDSNPVRFNPGEPILYPYTGYPVATSNLNVDGTVADYILFFTEENSVYTRYDDGSGTYPNPTELGTYNVLLQDMSNNDLADGSYIEFRIIPAEIDIDWDYGGLPARSMMYGDMAPAFYFVYGDSYSGLVVEKPDIEVTARFVDRSNNDQEITVNDESDVGEYTLKVFIEGNDAEYYTVKEEDKYKEFSITKREISVTAWYWHGVNIPNSFDEILYTGHAPVITADGSYGATLNITWTTSDMSAPQVSAYDGSYSLSQQGYFDEYLVNDAPVNVNTAGFFYYAVATPADSVNNYIADTDATRFFCFNIRPRTLQVTWAGGMSPVAIPYNGTAQIPSYNIEALSTGISLGESSDSLESVIIPSVANELLVESGKHLNVGVYESGDAAVISLADAVNYSIAGGDSAACEFTIEKIAPTISVSWKQDDLGRNLAWMYGESTNGGEKFDISLTYTDYLSVIVTGETTNEADIRSHLSWKWSNDNGENWASGGPISTTALGTSVKMKAVLSGSTNYSNAESDPISFEIEKPRIFVVPSSTNLTYTGAAQRPDYTFYKYEVKEGNDFEDDAIISYDNTDISAFVGVDSDPVIYFSLNDTANYQLFTLNNWQELYGMDKLKQEYSIGAKELTPTIAINNLDDGKLVYGVAPAIATSGVEGYLCGEETSVSANIEFHFYIEKIADSTSAYVGSTIDDVCDELETDNYPVGTYAIKYDFQVAFGYEENYRSTGAASTGAFTITKADLTITAKDHSITYGNVPANNGVDYTGFVYGQNEGYLGGTLGYAYNYEQYGHVGDYTITPSGYTSVNYNISFVSGTLTVDPYAITVDFDLSDGENGGLVSYTPTYDGKTYTITASANGVNDEIIHFVSSAAQTTVGSTSLTITAGDYKADGESTYANYVLTTDATSTTLVVGKKTIYVVPTGDSKDYGDDDPATSNYDFITAQLIGDDDVSVVQGKFVREAGENVIGAGYSYTGLGTFALSGADTDNYTLALGPNTAKFVIYPIYATWTAPTSAAWTYDGTSHDLVNAPKDVVGGEVKYKLGNGDWTTSIPTATAAGSYAVTVKVDADDNHVDISTLINLTVQRREITVSFISTSKIYDGTAIAPTYTLSGVQNVDKEGGEAEGAVIAENIDLAFVGLPTGATNPMTATFALTGTNAANYKLVEASGYTVSVETGSVSVSISRRDVYVIITGATSVYGNAKATTSNGMTITVDTTNDRLPVVDGEADPWTYTSWYEDTLNVDGYTWVADAGKENTKVLQQKNDSLNYNVHFTGNIYTVTARPVTVTFNDLDTVYEAKAKSVTATYNAVGGASNANMSITYGGEENRTDVTGNAFYALVSISDGNYTLVGGDNTLEGGKAKSGNYTITARPVTVTLAGDITAEALVYSNTAKTVTGTYYTWSNGAVSASTADAVITLTSAVNSNVNVGTFTVSIATGDGNYSVSGDTSKTYTITQAPFSIATPIAILTSSENIYYDGEEKTLLTAGSSTWGTMVFGYSVGLQEFQPEYATWYTLETFPKQTNAGNYHIYYKVEGTANYAGQASTEYGNVIINQAEDTALTTAIELLDTVYDEQEHQLITTAGVAKYGATVLYRVGGTGDGTNDPTTLVATNVGNYGIQYKIVGTFNYVGTQWSAVGTAKIAAEQATITTAPVAVTGLHYDGQAHALADASGAVYAGGTLEFSLNGTDYYEAIPTRTDATTYTVYYKVFGDANHSDSTVGNFAVTIDPKSILGATITLGTALTYNGGEQTQTVASVVIDELNATFEVSNNAKTNAGTYTLTVTGTGNFTGVDTKQFTIAPKPVSMALYVDGEETDKTSASITYDGSEHTFAVKANGGAILVVSDASTNVKNNGAGYSAGYEITNNYISDKGYNFSWSITKADLTGVSVEQDGTLTYNGEAQTAEVTTKGSTVDGTDVTFTYSADNVNWSEEVPTFTDWAENGHLVYYKADATNHKTYGGTFYVSIEAREITVGYTGGAKSVTYGDSDAWIALFLEMSENSWYLTADLGEGDGILDVVSYKIVDAKGTAVVAGNELAVGTYYLVVESVGNANYVIATDGEGNIDLGETATLTVTEATLTDVSVSQKDTLTYNGEAQTATVNKEAKAVNKMDVTFEYSLTDNSATGEGYGVMPPLKNYAKDGYTVFFKATAANHAPAYGNFIVRINQIEITVTIDAKNSKYGNVPEALSAQVTKGELVEDDAYEAGETPLPYSLSCEVTATSGIGNYDIRGTINNPNYDITFEAQKDAYTVSKRAISISYNGTEPIVKTYGDASVYQLNPYAYLTVGGDGLATGDQLNLVVPVTLSVGSHTGSPIMQQLSGENFGYAASYYLYIVMAGVDANYALTNNLLNDDNSKLVIEKAALTVTAENKVVTYGEATPDFTVKYSGFIGGNYNDSEAKLTGKLDFDCARVLTDDVGFYDITPKGLTAGNYDITFVPGRLEVEAAALAVELEIADTVYGTAVTAPAVDAGITVTGWKNGEKAIDKVTADKINLIYILKDGNKTFAEMFEEILEEIGEDEDAQAAFIEAHKAVPTLAGTYYAYIGVDGIANYDGDEAFAEFTIAKKAITVTAVAKNSDYGADLVPLTFTGDIEAGDVVCTIATNADNTKVGEYDIILTSTNNPNYTVTLVNGKYTINAKAGKVETNEAGEKVVEQTEDIKEEIKQAAADEKSEGVSIKNMIQNVIEAAAEAPIANLEIEVTEEATVAFDKAALAELAKNADVKITYTETKLEDVAEKAADNKALKNAQLIIEVSLNGATFEGGKATVKTAFENKAPGGKKAVVYFVDENGKKTDMKATFADGFVSFETGHFSTYVVEYVLTGGSIAGIIIGCVVGVAAIAFCLYFFVFRKKGGKGGDAAEAETAADEATEEAAEEAAPAEEEATEAPAEETPAEGEDK